MSVRFGTKFRLIGEFNQARNPSQSERSIDETTALMFAADPTLPVIEWALAHREPATRCGHGTIVIAFRGSH